MALPNVTIEYQNGGLGLVTPSDDRVVGLIFNGYGETSPPFVVFSYQDFVDKMGLLQAEPDQALNRVISSQVQDFYKVAGDGSELWIRTVAGENATAALFATLVPALIAASQGRINVVGISRALLITQIPDPIILTGGIDADIIAGLDEAQAYADQMAVQHMPVRFIIEGRFAAADLSLLASLKTRTFNRVGICLGADATLSSAMGLLLGRIAGTPVNRNIGRVKDGAVPIDAAYFTNGQLVDSVSMGAQNALHDKGYIFLRKFPNRAGYYWNDDHMATADTDDYFSLANGRTIDKAARIAYATFIDELLDTVTVNAETGKILKTTLKQYQARIERAIGLTMVAEGEISGVVAFVDPNQDVLATSRLDIDIRITPTGTNRVIRVRLGLFNPNVS